MHIKQNYCMLASVILNPVTFRRSWTWTLSIFIINLITFSMVWVKAVNWYYIYNWWWGKIWTPGANSWKNILKGLYLKMLMLLIAFLLPMCEQLVMKLKKMRPSPTSPARLFRKTVFLFFFGMLLLGKSKRMWPLRMLPRTSLPKRTLIQCSG